MMASKVFDQMFFRSALSVLAALAFVGVLFVFFAAPADADTTFTVNRTGDGADRNITDSVCDASSKTGIQCTLRAAIQESNDTSGPDKITFNIQSTTAVKTISPASSLPIITGALTINGYSQGRRTTTTSDDAKPNTLAEGNNADLKVQLDGTSAGAGVAGLTVTDADTTIKGLVINRFRGPGVLLTGSGATGNQIEGSFIGTDASGTRDLGNGAGSRSGVAIRGGSGNLVGGTGAGARNLISGNWQGISITGKGAANNRVENNYVGTDASGTNKLRNELYGVVITNASRNSIGGTAAGAGNVISGSLDYGVYMNGTTATENRVQGNLIGTDVSGTKALGNALSGVELYAAPGNLIGGTAAGAGNVISGNWRGVTAGGTNNRIEGNLIGTDASGSQKLPNEQSGVVVGGDNVVGGTVPGAGNVISGNAEHGILVGGKSRIEGNHIGTDASDAQDLGNGQFGIYISQSDNTIGKGNTIAHNPGGGVRIGGSRNKVEGNTIESNGGSGVDLIHSMWSPTNDNVIGGTTSAQANIIRDNGGAGVQARLLYETSTSGNSILTNSIFANGGLGIDLNYIGLPAPNSNDLDDPDAGTNNSQNFPVITSAERSTATGETTVMGTLNSNPNQTYTIQCFIAEAGSTDRNYGEGKTFLGQATTTTDANGDSPPFTCTSDIPAVGDKVSMTATNTSGTATNTRAGDTSEFSLNVEVTSNGT